MEMINIGSHPFDPTADSLRDGGAKINANFFELMEKFGDLEAIVSSPFLGSAVPTDTPAGSGKGFWLAAEAGTYTAFGGVIVLPSSMAVISRDSVGAFSISQTPFVFDPVDRSVGYVKLTDYKAGKNMFDKDRTVFDFYINSSDGQPVPDAAFNITPFIDAKAGEEYSHNGTNGVFFYGTGKAYLGYTMDTVFTTPSGTVFIRATITDVQIPSYQMEAGSAATPYESFNYTFSKFRDQNAPLLLDGSVDQRKMQKYLPGRNLFDKSKAIAGYYIDSANGQLVPDAGFMVSDFINAEPAVEYSYNSSYGMFFYGAGKNYLGYAVGVTNTSPAGTAFIRLSLTAAILDSLQIEKGISPSRYQPFRYAYEGLSATRGRWDGKKANFLGDSITYGLGLPDRENNCYPARVSDKQGVSVMRNYGVSSSPISKITGFSQSFLERYPSMDSDYGLLVIFGGANDYRSGVPIGLPGSTNEYEFYGAMKALLQGTLGFNSGARVCFITPYIDNETVFNIDYVNSAGHVLKDYIDAIHAVCDKYAVPVLDLYRNSGINSITEGNLTEDGLHPNVAGSEHLANMISSFINNL